MKRILMTIVAGLLIGLAGAADVTISSSETWTATDYAAKGLTASDTITISSGATLTFSLAQGDALTVPCTIAGAGGVTVAGALGKITFSGNNTFTGAFTTAGATQGSNKNVSNWITVTSATGLGKGTVRVTDGVRVILAVTGVANAFEVSHAYGMLVFNSADMDFNGTITWTGAANGTLRFAAAKKVNLRGAINAGTAGIHKTDDAAQTEIHVYGKMTAAYVGADSGSSFFRWNTDPSSTGTLYNHGRGTWYFHSPGDGVQHEVGYPSASGLAQLVIEDADCFAETAILSLGYKNSYAEGNNPVATLKADQTFASLYENTASFLKDETPLRLRVTSNTKATLTLKGSSDSTSYAVFDGNVSLNWDSADKRTLTLSKRAHLTKGTLKVSSGTVKADASTTFSALGALDVSADGVFASEADVFAAAQVEAVVAAGGKIAPAANTALTLKSLMHDGVPVVPGTYSSASWMTSAAEATVTIQTYPTVVWTQADYDAYMQTHDSIDFPGGTLVFDYDSTMSSTVSCPITGGMALEIRGTGGTIVFSGTSTYTGGTTISGATRVEVKNGKAFGSGKITVAGTASSDYAAGPGLFFRGSFAIDNPIEVTKSSYLSFYDGTINVNGKITATATTRFRVADPSGSWGDTSVVNFYGDIEAPNQTLMKVGNSYGTLNFYGKMTAKEFYGDYGDWGRGAVNFYSSGNEVGIVAPSLVNITLAVPNAFPETVTLGWGYPNQNYRQANSGTYALTADQTVDRMASYGSSWPTDMDFSKKETDNIGSTTGKTLTMKGRGNGWTYTRLTGSLNLTWDPVGDYTFALSNRAHTTSGKITVKGGTLIAGGKTSFTNLTGLVVAPGAQFLFRTTVAEGFTDKLQSLVIGDETSVLELPDGQEFTVAQVCVNGEVFAGDEIVPGPTCPWLHGNNVKINVTHANNIWTVPSGSWGTAANWAVGVPSATLDAQVLSWGAQSVTATVDAVAAPVNGLTVGTTVGASGTATVAVGSSLEMVSGKNLEIVDKGIVEVKDGGTLKLPSSGDSVLSKAYVRKGGELKMTGGTFSFKNPKNCWAGDAIRTSDGSAVNLSGTARLEIESGTTATHLFGGGVTTFAGSSSIGGCSLSGIYLNPPDAGCSGVVRVVEHAAWFPASKGLRPVFLNVGTTAGRPVYMEFTSDAASWLCQALRLGEGKGTGELTISGGSVTIDYRGVSIAGTYEQHGVLCTPTGVMRVTGGTVAVSGSENNFSGTIVGDGHEAATDASGNLLDNLFRGRLDISGDATYKNTGKSQVVVGVGQAEAELNQSGGTLTAERTDLGGATIIGMAGAKGVWTMTGGTATLSGYLYVGGITTDELGRQISGGDGTGRRYPAELGPDGTGKLVLSGGTMTVAQDLVFSAEGTGTLELKPGCKLSVAGNLDARAGSKLVVDVRGYAGRATTLATFGGTTTAFADVEVLKGDEDHYAVRVTDTQIRVVRDPAPGFTVIVR